MAGASPLLAETPQPLGSEVPGSLGPAFRRPLKPGDGLLLSMTPRIIPAPPHGLANKTGVCLLSGSLPRGLGGQHCAEGRWGGCEVNREKGFRVVP